MRTVSLLTKAYGPYRNRLITTIKNELKSSIGDLDIEIIKVTIDSRNHLRVTISGEDEEFVTNHLAKTYGECLALQELAPNIVTKGSLVDVGKVGFGLFVDIGLDPSLHLDPLIPLHQLRSQIGVNRPLREISKNLCLMEHLPIEVRITQVNLTNQRVEAELSSEALETLHKWSTDDHERLLVFGANQEMIEAALKRSGHAGDIYESHCLGRFETALVCKRSTRASGIVAAIGPRLKGIPIHLFVPNAIGAWRHDKA
jgi:hypothetical protein